MIALNFTRERRPSLASLLSITMQIELLKELKEISWLRQLCRFSQCIIFLRSPFNSPHSAELYQWIMCQSHKCQKHFYYENDHLLAVHASLHTFSQSRSYYFKNVTHYMFLLNVIHYTYILLPEASYTILWGQYLVNITFVLLHFFNWLQSYTHRLLAYKHK